LHNRDLHVGHSPASLTSNRTLRSLYIDPLVQILDHQNPKTEFYRPGAMRNGVFDGEIYTHLPTKNRKTPPTHLTKDACRLAIAGMNASLAAVAVAVDLT